jgi:small subunit ribosomal protein S1
MSTIKQEVKLKEPSELFDFDNNQTQTFIPKYRDIKEEIELGNSKYSKNFLSLFNKYDGRDDVMEVEPGNIIKGVVCEINQREVVVDIGNKDNVIIDRKGQEEKICRQLNVNQEIDVLIVEVSDSPFLIRGSISDLVRMKVDHKMKDFYNNNIEIKAIVKETIPAGYLLNIEIDDIIIDAFMPNTLADVNRLYNPELLLDKEIKVMLETLQQDKGVYVVSRKKYLKTLIPEKVKQLKTYPKDKVYTGHVTGTRDFGIFIQFEDCLTGMIHKANIREDYQDIIQTIKPGTLIDFYIKDITKNGSQIILTQILKDSLWDTIRVGDTINGKIAAIKPFGALIELDYETNGLIQTTYINKNNKKLSVGDKIDVVVISIIRDDRKIYLTFADDNDMIDKLKDKSDELEKLKQKFNSK